MLTEIRVPKMNGAGWSFQKFNRRAQDWAIVGVAAWRGNGDAGVGARQHGLDADPGHQRRQRPWPAGRPIDDAAEQAVAEADPQADLNASVEYRKHLAKVLTRRALRSRQLSLTLLAPASGRLRTIDRVGTLALLRSSVPLSGSGSRRLLQAW